MPFSGMPVIGEQGIDQRLDERFAEETESQRGDGDAELVGGEITVEMVDHMQRELRVAGLFLGLRLRSGSGGP